MAHQNEENRPRSKSATGPYFIGIWRNRRFGLIERCLTWELHWSSLGIIRPAKYCNLKHCVVHIDETHFFFVMNIRVIVRGSFVDDLAFAVNKKCVLRYFIPD